MYRREFLEAAGATGAAASLPGEKDETEGEAARITGELSISIDDGPLYLCGYPLDDNDELENGDVFLSAGQGDVRLGVVADSDDRHAEAALSFDPETADEVADMLREFAERARNDERRVYP